MKVIGLISGTSADGIDAALCEITGAPPQIEARILHAITYPYSDGLQERVLEACIPAYSRVDTICQLNADLGEEFAAAALWVIEDAGLEAADIDLIGSHGQNVWHMVQPDGHVSATFQITEASVIAERTGITTISNLRARDVAAGGQGAPLASYLDWLLLRRPEGWRAVQNLGGIANVTFLPPLSDSEHNPVAFDTGPSNALIDILMAILTGGQLGYDKDGIFASHGEVDKAWLLTLLNHPYFAQKPPKSTGREVFGPEMAETLLRQGRALGLDDSSIVATVTALTAASIADAYQRFAPAPIVDVILAGGGTHNPTLVRMLQKRLSPRQVFTHDEIGIDNDNKEALLFALLAYETWHARPGTHPAMTGARHASVLGQITPGLNYADLLRRTWCR